MEKNEVKFASLVSREERHYCAYLFAWFLIDKKKNIKTYFQKHSNSESIFPDIEKIEFENCEVYYEYTAIREWIYYLKHVYKDSDKAQKVKSEAESEIFPKQKGDIQKKKADLAFYFPKEKLLILTEAKFEMGFDENQIEQTKGYGEYLKKHFSNAIKDVKCTLLGLKYYNDKRSNLPSISWEELTEIIGNNLIINEITKGLDFQGEIHTRAMTAWNAAKKSKNA